MVPRPSGKASTGPRSLRCQEAVLTIFILVLLSGVGICIHRTRSETLKDLQVVNDRLEASTSAHQTTKKDLVNAKEEIVDCNASLTKERENTAVLEKKIGAAKYECAQAIEQTAKEAKAKEACQDPNQVRLDLSKTILEAEIHRLRAFLEKYKTPLETEWQSKLEKLPPKGILMAAGSTRYLLNAFVTLYSIRKYWNSTLPVTIMYWGEAEIVNGETEEFFKTSLGKPYVEFIDASSQVEWPVHHRSLLLPGQYKRMFGWALKLAAAYLAPYQEVLYMDADSSPLVKPESLFNLSKYNKTGSLFWPDTVCQRPYIIDDFLEMGLISENDAPGEYEAQIESGQWLIDKRRHREPLEYIMLLGTHSDYGFAKSFGDKDLFRAGFVLAGKATQFSLVPVSLGFAWGVPDGMTDEDGNRKNTRLMRGYIQYSPNGQPLFHHRAGWQTKYGLRAPEGRALDAFSAPLPCSWTHKFWPMESPGAMDDTHLRLVDPKKCPYSYNEFKRAVSECGDGFDGSPGQRVPIFEIKGTIAKDVHIAHETGWKMALKAREENGILFENKEDFNYDDYDT